MPDRIPDMITANNFGIDERAEEEKKRRDIFNEDYRNSLPVWDQYNEFMEKMRGDENWALLDDKAKRRVLKKNFDLDDPKDLFTSDEAASWDEQTFERTKQNYLQSLPEFNALGDNQEQRQRIHQMFVDGYNDYHHDARQQQELEKRFAQQKADEEAIDKAAYAEELRQLSVQFGGERLGNEGFAPVKPLEKFEQPEAVNYAETKQFGRAEENNRVRKMFAEAEEFKDDPEKAAFYADAFINIQGNPNFHAAPGVERNRIISSVTESPWAQENMTPAERVAFRVQMNNAEGLSKPHADGYDVTDTVGSTMTEGFLDSMIRESRRGGLALNQMWQSSIERATLEALQDVGIEPEWLDTAIEGNAEKIADVRRRMKDVPVSEFGERVYSGDANIGDRAAWLAEVTYSSLISYGPAIPLGMAAGSVAGAPGLAMVNSMMSGALEYGPSILDYLETEKGIDVENPDELLKAFTNKELMAETKAYARARAIPIAAVDGLTSVVGYKVGGAKAAAQKAAKKAGVTLNTNWWKEMGATMIEAGGGGFGEAMAQWFSTGEVNDVNAIIAEMVGEVPTAGVDIATGYVAETGQRLRDSKDFDLSGIGHDFGDKPPTPKFDRTGATRSTSGTPAAGDDGDVRELTDEQLVAPAGLDEGQASYYDGLDREEKTALMNDALDRFNFTMDQQMKRYGYTDEQVSEFPENELEDIQRTSFADALESHRGSQEETDAETPSKPPEGQTRTPVQDEPAAAEPDAAPRTLTVKEIKAMLKEAKTEEELDFLEREWQDRGKTESPGAAKAFIRARQNLNKQEIDVGDTESDLLDILQVQSEDRIGDLANESRIRYTDEDGVVQDGVIREGLSDESVVAVELDDGSFEYLDNDDTVGVVTDRRPQEKPKPKAKVKAQADSDRVDREGRESWNISPDEGLKKGERIVAANGENSVVVETQDGEQVEVDEGIAPLIQRLNDSGFETSYSMSAYPEDYSNYRSERNGEYVETPGTGDGYIAFKEGTLTEEQKQQVREAGKKAGLHVEDSTYSDGSPNALTLRVQDIKAKKNATTAEAKKRMRAFEEALFGKPKKKKKAKPKKTKAKRTPEEIFAGNALHVDTETGEPVVADRLINGTWQITREDGTREDIPVQKNERGEVVLPDRYVRKEDAGAAAKPAAKPVEKAAKPVVPATPRDTAKPQRRRVSDAIDTAEEEVRRLAADDGVDEDVVNQVVQGLRDGSDLNDIMVDSELRSFRGAAVEAAMTMQETVSDTEFHTRALEDPFGMRRREGDPAPEAEEVEAKPVAEGPLTLSGVEVPTQANGKPSLKSMKAAVDAAKTTEELDAIIEAEGEEPRKSLSTKINKKREELSKPKKTPAQARKEKKAKAKKQQDAAVAKVRAENKRLSDEAAAERAAAAEAKPKLSLDERARDRHGANFADLIKWVKELVKMDTPTATMHGLGNIGDLGSILRVGLKKGTAIGHSDWVSENEIVVKAPDVEEGEYVEHNNYYRSAEDAKVTEVIIDEEGFTDFNSLIPLLKDIQAENPDVKMDVVRSNGDVVPLADVQATEETLKSIEDEIVRLGELETEQMEKAKKATDPRKKKAFMKMAEATSAESDKALDRYEKLLEAEEATEAEPKPEPKPKKKRKTLADKVAEKEEGAKAKPAPAPTKKDRKEINTNGTVVIKNPEAADMNAMEGIFEAAYKKLLATIEPVRRSQERIVLKRKLDDGIFPGLRGTFDTDGNLYIWRSDLGTHADFIPAIERTGATVNEDRNFLEYHPSMKNPEAKKENKAPKDAAKPKAVPKSTKKKTKKDARKDAPKEIRTDKNGASLVNDLRAIMKGADSAEIIEAAFNVYLADIKTGRRKRRSLKLEKLRDSRLDEIAGAEVLAKARPTVQPKAKKKKVKKVKETDEQAAERMERDMNAEWPWPREDTDLDEEYEYFGKLDTTERLESELYDEITHRWLLTNGVRDAIDPHFFQQVVNEIGQFVDDTNFEVSMDEAAHNVFERLVGEEAIDENRQLRWFLVQEYPGATTLKEASGENTSKKSGTPINVFSKWLEESGIREEDATEDRSEALERLSKARKSDAMVEPAKTKEKKKTAADEMTDEEVEARGEDAIAEAEDEYEELVGDPVEVLDEEVESISEDMDLEDEVEERVKKDYPTISGAIEREMKVPTFEDIKRVFKIGWDIEVRSNGFSLTRQRDGMRVDVLYTDVHEVLRQKLLTNSVFYEKMKREFGVGNVDSLVRLIAVKHVALFRNTPEGEKVLKHGAAAALGTYGYDAMNGIHAITLDNRLADNVSLWHESLHMWLRVLATDQEMETIFSVFDTEEEFTGFMGVFMADEDRAMQMAEKKGANPKQRGKLASIANGIFELFEGVGKLLGYHPGKERDAARARRIDHLYQIAEKMLSGDAFLAVERANRYVGDENTTGIDKDAGGRIVRSGFVRRRGPTVTMTPASVLAADDTRVYENTQAETPSQVPNEPRPNAQDANSRPGGTESNSEPIIIEKRRQRDARKVIRWVKQNMTKNRGVPAELRQLVIKMHRMTEKGKYRGRAASNRLKKIVKDLRKQHGKDRVSQSLSMVLDGRMPVSQFARIYSLEEDNPALASLQSMLDYQTEIQTKLFENPSIPEKIRKQIIANQFYQTRFYAVHVLGDNFVVPDEHFITAVDAMLVAHEHEIVRLIGKAQKAIGVRNPFDLPSFLYGSPQQREAMLEGLSDSRKSAIERAARSLANWVPAFESIRLENGTLVADWSVDSLRAIAEQTVEGYLDNAVMSGKKIPGPIGGMPVTNMMHRKLDVVFRDLYGEITNPDERMARTMEVQGELIATGAFFQKMFEDGHNVWWSEGRQGEFNKRLSENEHGGRLTPQDRNKYGNMAGKWVTQETYDLINGTGPFQRELDRGIKKHAQYIQGVTRGTRLLWPKTIARNALTAVTGFAFRSGDATYSEFWKRYLEGTELMIRIDNALATGKDPEALEILADLIEKDVFDVSHESIIQDIQANLRNIDLEHTSFGKQIQKALQMYSMIDLPAKYASYHTRLSLGDTEAQAVEHVHKFYQYRDSVPEFVSKMNRWGLGDYFGYTWDSTRIFLNVMQYAATEAAKGNPRPLFGTIASLTIPAFRYGTGGITKILAPTLTVKMAAAGWNLLAAVLGDEYDDEEKFRVATAEEVGALRDSLPSYDRDVPLAVWYERESADDPWTLKWQVLGNLSAFPIEDLVMGAIQSAAQSPNRSFTEALLSNINQAAPYSPGMFPENLWTLLTGDEGIFEEGYKRPGLLHVARDVKRAMQTDTPLRSDWGRILAERTFQYAGETFVPGQATRVMSKIYEIHNGRDPMIGRAIDTPEWDDVNDIFWRLVRKYDMNKDTQIKALRNMVAGELEAYDVEKYLAGEAGRLNMKWSDGNTDIELNRSDRARENWHTLLMAIEKKVGSFRTLSKGNFSDKEIAIMLKNFGSLRTSEIEHIVNGTVQDMTGEDFTIDHKPLPTQRGDDVIIKYFDENEVVNYRDIHAQLVAAGYVPGKYGRGFRTRVKKLRKEWYTSGNG